MKSFASADQMLDAHEAMFGKAGRQAAEIVLDWAPRLFAVPLDPLAIRVVLAPVEIGPYNRRTGYHIGAGEETSSSAIGISAAFGATSWCSRTLRTSPTSSCTS